MTGVQTCALPISTIQRCRPVLYFEARRDQTPERLICEILGLCYRLWWQAVPAFSVRNFLGNRRNDFPNVVYSNLIGLPADVEPPAPWLLQEIVTPHGPLPAMAAN